MTPKSSPRPSLEEDAEALLRDVAQDAVQAARVGWRIAGRFGRLGVSWFDRTSSEMLDSLERRTKRRNPP